MSRRLFVRQLLALGAVPAAPAVAGCGSSSAVDSPAKFSPRPNSEPTSGGKGKSDPPTSKSS